MTQQVSMLTSEEFVPTFGGAQEVTQSKIEKFAIESGNEISLNWSTPNDQFGSVRQIAVFAGENIVGATPIDTQDLGSSTGTKKKLKFNHVDFYGKTYTFALILAKENSNVYIGATKTTQDGEEIESGSSSVRIAGTQFEHLTVRYKYPVKLSDRDNPGYLNLWTADRSKLVQVHRLDKGQSKGGFKFLTDKLNNGDEYIIDLSPSVYYNTIIAASVKFQFVI